MAKKSLDVITSALAGLQSRPADAPRRPLGSSFLGRTLREDNASMERQLADYIRRFGDDALPVRPIPVDHIQLSARPNRLPVAFDAALDPGFAELKADLEASGGNSVPILVRPLADDRYELVYGERRLRACQQLGVPVNAIIAPLSDDDAALLQLRENQSRKDVSVIERAYQIVSAFPAVERGEHETLAGRLGVTTRTLHRLRLIGQLPTALCKAHPDARAINVRDAYAMAVLHGEQPGVLAKRIAALPAMGLGAAAATAFLLHGAGGKTRARPTPAFALCLDTLSTSKQAAFLADLRGLLAQYGLPKSALVAGSRTDE